MHGQHRRRAPVELPFGTRVVRAQVDRRERRVPVVGMEQDGRLRDRRQHAQRRKAEEREPPVVVLVVAPAVPVDLLAAEVLGVVDEQDPRLPLERVVHQGARFVEPPLLAPRTHLHVKRVAHGLEVGRDLEYLFVQGHDDDRPHAEPCLVVRQARDGFAQSTGAGEGRQLRSEVDDRHRLVGRARGQRVFRRGTRRLTSLHPCGRGWGHRGRCAPASAFHGSVTPPGDRRDRHHPASPAHRRAARIPSASAAR